MEDDSKDITPLEHQIYTRWMPSVIHNLDIHNKVLHQEFLPAAENDPEFLKEMELLRIKWAEQATALGL